MNRREFLAKAGLAATWAGISIRVSACSDDGGGGLDPGGDVTGDVDLHAHSGAVVTEAQLAAGSAVTLNLRGAHNHVLNLTAPQVMDIADGAMVSAMTDPDGTGHVHTVTFN